MGWGSGNLGGGSGGLNFKIVGGASEPSNPKENTIWVITDVPITTWIFSTTQPEPPADGKDGPVWFLTGTSSQVAFNALKKHVIELNPMSAKQYIGGAWVDREAKSYQNGELVAWWDGELFKYGNEFDSVTGGWVCTPAPYNKAGDGSSGAEMIPTKNENGGYTLYHGFSTKGAIWHTANKIDVTDVQEIKFVGSFSATNGNHVGMALYSKIDYCIQNRAAFMTGVLQYGTHTLNVADVQGEYYIGFHVYNANTIVVDEVIME